MTIDFTTTFPDDDTGTARYEWYQAFIDNVCFAACLEADYWLELDGDFLLNRKQWFKHRGFKIFDDYFAPSGG